MARNVSTNLILMKKGKPIICFPELVVQLLIGVNGKPGIQRGIISLVITYKNALI